MKHLIDHRFDDGSLMVRIGQYWAGGEFSMPAHLVHDAINDERFQKRIEAGSIRGEYGTPMELRLSNVNVPTDKRAFIKRVSEIDERRVAFSVMSIKTREIKAADGSKMCGVLARIMPCGPHGDDLRTAISTGVPDLGFAMRAFTEQDWTGITKINEVITWDVVPRSQLRG